MKTLLVTLISLTLSVSASAQRHFSGGHVYSRSRVVVVPSLSFYGGWGLGYPYGYFGYPFGYFDYPMYGARAYRTPKMGVLNDQINSIKSDYKFKIKAVRQDKTITRTQRRQEILNLKSEREAAIQAAQTKFLNKSQATKPDDNTPADPGHVKMS